MATLKLKEENIYSAGYVVSLPDSKQILKTNPILYTPSSANDKGYVLKEDERLWDVAYRAYGNSKWWFVIASINNIYNPFEVTAGTNLIIPDLDVVRIARR